MDLSAFLEEFKLEAFEHLEKLGSGLLSLERTPGDAELIRRLFLSAHTIKGGASMLELRALRTLTHAFEDALTRLREGKASADAATVTLLLRVTDEIKRIVETDPTLQTPAPQTQSLIEVLQGFARGESPITPRDEVAAKSTPTAHQPLEPLPDTTATQRAAILEPSATASVLVKLQLETLDWAVTVCDSSEHLLAVAAHSALVVVPLEPPGGVDGLALAQQLRDEYPALEIALSVLECSDAERLEAEGLGVRVVPLTAWNENPFWRWSATAGSPA